MIKKIIYLIYKVIVTFFNRTKTGRYNKLLSHHLYDSFLGDYNYIGPGVIINNTKIGNFCSIAAYTQIGGMEHDFNKFSTSTYLNHGKKLKMVTIQDDVWIGAAVYIKNGVTIGKGAVIGAGTIVLEDIPEYAIAVGVPAKVIKDRFDPVLKKYHSKTDFSQNIEDLRKINEDFNSRR